MTKGQKIIGGLLIVVAGLLALNLSGDVGGQDVLPPRGLPDEHGQDVWNEEAFALDEIRQAIKDASWASSRNVERMIEANEAAQRARLLEFNRSFKPGLAGIPSAAQNWPRPLPRSSGGATSSGLTSRVAALDYKLDKLREMDGALIQVNNGT